jgi:hypothetical protein
MTKIGQFPVSVLKCPIKQKLSFFEIFTPSFALSPNLCMLENIHLRPREKSEPELLIPFFLEYCRTPQVMEEKLS